MLKELDQEYIDRIIKALKDKGITPEIIILHGSYAKGTYIRGLSDVDILVISKDFRDLNLHERFSLLADIFKGFRPRIEAIGYTMEELKDQMRKLNLIVLDALEYGKPIYDVGKYNQLIKEFNILKRKLELKPIRRGWKFK